MDALADFKGLNLMNNKMRFKDEVRHKWEGAKNIAVAGIALSALYLGVTAVFNIGIVYPTLTAWNGIERAIGAQRTKQVATLVDSESIRLHNDGVIYCGDFRTKSGDEFKLCDGPDVLAGKFLPNRYLPGAETGREYEVDSLQGPLSAKVLGLTPISWNRS
jgi:hypothetical protein